MNGICDEVNRCGAVVKMVEAKELLHPEKVVWWCVE
jgi:hypothetical protein